MRRGRATRRRERKALELKDYEFNAHGVELGQRYASAAVADPAAELLGVMSHVLALPI
jgi:hypothetical protein